MEDQTKLSNILNSSAHAGLANEWKKAPVAGEFKPLPAGEYVAHIVQGKLFTSLYKGTPGYNLTFRVVEGEYAGRRFWHDIWLTLPAMPMAKRDLGKLGMTSLEQLDQPLPQGIRCRVNVVLRRDDSDREYNRVRSFEVIGHDKPEVDPYAPKGEEVTA